MKFRYHAVCILNLVLASVGLAQIGDIQLNWNITGAGARADGFGGAFIGVADDATAIVWNPAGLGQIERAEISGVGRYIQEVSEDKDEISKITVENTYSHFNPNFASLVVPFTSGNSNIVLAAAYQSQLDFYYKLGNDSISSSGAANTVTPGIAVRFGPVLSVGAAANIWLGSAEYQEKASGVTSKLDFKFSGLNFAGGLLLDFSGLENPIPLKLGATVRTPFTLKSDVDASINFAGTTSNGKVTWEVEMPLMAGFGTSVQIGESFTLAADYEMRLFADKKSNIVTPRQGLPDTTISGPMSDHNENLNQVRVGGEYLIVMKGGVIPIRAGFRTVPTLYSDYEWDQARSTYNSKNAASGIGFSVGTGFISNSFALDFAFSHDQYDQKWTDAGKTDFSYSYNVNRFSGSIIVYL